MKRTLEAPFVILAPLLAVALASVVAAQERVQTVNGTVEGGYDSNSGVRCFQAEGKGFTVMVFEARIFNINILTSKCAREA